MTETARLAALRAAGAVAVREVGGDVLHPRVPRTTSSSCARRCSSRCPGTLPSPRSTAGWSARSARSTTTTSRRCARPRAQGRAAFADALPPGDGRAARPRRRSRRSSSTRRSARRSASGDAAAALLWGAAHTCAHGVPRVGAARRLRRRGTGARRGALRGDPHAPLGRHLHRRRVRGDLAPPRHAGRHASTSRSPSCSTSSRACATSGPRARRRRSRSCSPAGERRSSTANTIFRDPAWRKKDARGALRMSPDDAAAPRRRRRRPRPRHDPARHASRPPSRSPTRCSPVTSACRTASGSPIPDDGGGTRRARRRAERADRRPRIATGSPGTPWHKHVRARLEAVAGLRRAAHPLRRLAVPDRAGHRPDRRLVDAARAARGVLRPPALRGLPARARRAARRARRGGSSVWSRRACSTRCRTRSGRRATSTA